jgi:hypothetical protein
LQATLSSFDPYQAWLGIEPHEQPADYYRLLGLPRFEADEARIAKAADERMALVRSYQMGPRRTFTQKLLNELSAARVCLLGGNSKSEYDAALARQLLPAGIGHALPVTAPPQLPPPAPAEADRFALPVTRESGQPPLLTAPAPWWRPLLVALALALAMPAAVGSWAWIRWRWPAIASAPSEPLPHTESPPPAPRQIVLFQEGSGEVLFSAATARLTGGVELHVQGTEEVLAHWLAPEDSAAWQFRLVKPGFFQVELTYATSAADGELELVLGERTKSCPLRPTGGLDQYLSDTFTVAIPAGGEHTLIIRPVRQPEGDWLILKTVRFVPVGGELPPAEPGGQPPEAESSDST